MAYSTTAYPYDAVCYIVVTMSDGNRYQGSAAIIGAHTILTASHMLWDQDTNAQVASIKIYPSYQQGGAAINTTSSASWIAHFNKIDDSGGKIGQDGAQADYAIIDVAANLSAYGSFGVETNYAGGTVHVTGYPATASGVQTDQVGTVTRDRFYSVLDYGTVSTSPGASGGPIWVDTGTAGSPNPLIVGIVSTSGFGVLLTAADWQTIQGWENADSALWGGNVPVSLSFGAATSLTAPTSGLYNVYGGNGLIDTLSYASAAARYTINLTNEGAVVNISLGTLVTTLFGVQQARFSDYTVVFDLVSSQDKLVYELYQAAYGRAPDNTGFRFWAGQADATGMSALKLADAFLAAPEFTRMYGAAPTNAQYVNELYANVLGRAPDAAGLAYWTGQANAGLAHDQLLVSFATSAENVQMVGAHTTSGFWTT